MQGNIQIGSLNVSNPFWLSPMAGYTDWAMRSVCAEFGAGLTYTEVINAEGLVHHIPLTLLMMDTASEESHVVGHLYGRDPDTMAAAATLMEATGRFAAIDINTGCPVRKIVAKGAGVALMKDPVRVGEIVKVVKSAVRLPVMVKTRVGLERGDRRVFRLMEEAVRNGVDALAVHGRYAVDRHTGPVHLDLLKEVNNAAGIPVIGNGGIEYQEQALQMMEMTGVTAVLIGKASVGRPWIFQDCLAGREEPLSATFILSVMKRHLDRLVTLRNKEQTIRKRSRYSGEKLACMRFRGHLVKYLSGCRGVKELLRNSHTIHTVDEMLAASRQVLETDGL